MKPITSRFQKFELSEAEDVFARTVSPYFWGYLQNKIADYADAALEVRYEDDKIAAILEHERRKAQVEILEELMRELIPPQEYIGDNNSTPIDTQG